MISFKSCGIINSSSSIICCCCCSGGDTNEIVERVLFKLIDEDPFSLYCLKK